MMLLVAQVTGKAVVLHEEGDGLKCLPFILFVPNSCLNIHITLWPTKVIICSWTDFSSGPGFGPHCALYKTVHLPGHAPVHILGLCAA